MRIGMVLQTRFPPDIRVEKEVSTLVRSHDVHILCPKRAAQVDHEVYCGAEVHRVLSRASRWWSNWRLLSSCRSGLWEHKIDEFVLHCRIEALHVHDLPLLGPALAVAKRRGIPVVADLHENYPAMLEQSYAAPLRQLTSAGSLAIRLTLSVSKWRSYERRAIADADHVITVVDEARDRLVAIGVPASKIHVVGNYASQDELGRMLPPLPAGTGLFRLVYAGGFDETRDLETVVDAVGLLPQATFPDLQVILVGGTGRALKNLESYANVANDNRLRILPWSPLGEVEALMETAQLGLVPHVKSAHTDATIPHKLFQYMWRHLPVIVSDCAPLERIVRETGCGKVYSTGDAHGLAGSIATLYQDREACRVMGQNGHQAVKEKYNWGEAGDVLLRVYEACVA